MLRLRSAVMLRTTHTTTVTEDQIDHLGHMNVRYYAQNARVGSRRLVESLAGWDAADHELFDLYTRHHREQLLGSRLEVRSGVLSVDTNDLVVHHELMNIDTGDLAAPRPHRLHPVAQPGARGAVGANAVATPTQQAVGLPASAAPRPIAPDHDHGKMAPGLAELNR